MRKMVKKISSKDRLGWLLLIFFLALGGVLRIAFLDKIPQGFNWDEASIGYNGYSLLKTGKDEFGRPWPIFLEAFGEYKTGIYSMLLVPVIKLFGLSIFTVRAPNAIFGCFLILASFYLGLQAFKKALPASLVAGLVAISPWAVHTSRFALEWYFGMALAVGGFGFLLASRKKRYLMLPAALFLAVSFYSYHALRLLVPLLLFSYAVIFRKEVLKEKKILFTSLIIGFLVLLPLMNSMRSNKWFSRALDVAIFGSKEVESELMEDMYRHTVSGLPFVRVFNNKVVFYGKEILDKYLAHFSPQFLFSGQDVTPRIGIEKVGKLYYVSLAFLVFGLYEILRKRNKLNRFLLLWLFLAPLPSSLTTDSPHALRSLLMIPVLQIITVYGMVVSYRYLRLKKSRLIIPFFAFFSLFYFVGFVYFLWRYFLFYPEDSANFWQDGHKQMVEKFKNYRDRFEKIVITTHYGQPHIFVAFFMPVDPNFYQREVAKPDQQEIFNERIPHLGKIEFRQISADDFYLPNTLVITENRAAPENLPPLDVVKTANRFYEEPVLFKIFDTNRLTGEK